MAATPPEDLLFVVILMAATPPEDLLFVVILMAAKPPEDLLSPLFFSLLRLYAFTALPQDPR